MKLQFEANLKHQNQAVKAVTDLFQGITTLQSQFEIGGRMQMTIDELANGYTGEANEITNPNWMHDVVENNLPTIQATNNISERHSKPTRKIFDIEMETGTGKTYVFLKTIFELNQIYGFRKFVILVPSIAIREGVKKNLEITREHFRMLYHNLNYRFYEYEGDKPQVVYDFAQNNNIEIMIMNIQQINKSLRDDEINPNKNINNIYKHHDSLGGQRPIDLIRGTQPILIIDEPQSTSSGGKSVNAIENLNPLFTLRYSATFRAKDRANLVYRLNAFDAYNQNLVKKITVYASQLNVPSIHMELISTNAKDETCKIRLDKKIFTMKKGDDLKLATQNQVYENYVIEDIHFQIQEVVFTNGQKLQLLNNDEIYSEVIKTQLIRTTIKAHLEKELTLHNKRNIKVLSLFFLDKVSNYREYDATGKARPGKYAQIFETEFLNLAQKPRYQTLFTNVDLKKLVTQIHDGYFSKDAKGNLKDTKGDSKDDISTYDKIMKDKERLLSLDEPLKFIFSHSALKEGWDNPNVFQICTLNENAKSDIKKRQQIGRGLRLCVNQQGERIYDERINQLSIITAGNFEDFVKGLQSEMEDEGVNLREFSPHSFCQLGLETSDSRALFAMLKQEGLLNQDDQINKVIYRPELLVQKLDEHFPDQYNLDQKDKLIAYLKNTINIQNGATKTRKNQIKPEVLHSPEFVELWNKIKHKTIYKVKFDSEHFIQRARADIQNQIDANHQNQANLQTVSVDLKMNQEAGVAATNQQYHGKTEVTLATAGVPLKNIVNLIEEKTRLTKRTIARILNDEQIIAFIKANPHNAHDKLIERLQYQKQALMIEGIEYTKITNDHYQLTLFENEEIPEAFDQDDQRYVKVEADAYNKYPYEYVKTESHVETDFAKESLRSPVVNKFLKLPRWFKVPTPLGMYNPDWSIYHEDKLIFIAETKGSTKDWDLRPKEKWKIECGKKHFQALGTADKIIFKEVTKLKKLF